MNGGAATLVAAFRETAGALNAVESPDFQLPAGGGPGGGLPVELAQQLATGLLQMQQQATAAAEVAAAAAAAALAQGLLQMQQQAAAAAEVAAAAAEAAAAAAHAQGLLQMQQQAAAAAALQAQLLLIRNDLACALNCQALGDHLSPKQLILKHRLPLPL